MLFLNYRERITNVYYYKYINYLGVFLGKKEKCIMINDEICILREKLNKSIEDGEDYSIIYKLSVELDELITRFYNEKEKKS